MTVRKIISAVVVACIMVASMSSAALAADTSHSEHTHMTRPDASTLAVARTEFAEDMKGKGGVVFDTKGEALSYIMAHSRVTEETLGQKYVPEDCDAYVVLPASAAASVLPEAQGSASNPDDLVLLAGKWCPSCRTIVVWWGMQLLGGVVTAITWATVKWLWKMICSICQTPVGQEETTIRTECPDCGPDGDIMLSPTLLVGKSLGLHDADGTFGMGSGLKRCSLSE